MKIYNKIKQSEAKDWKFNTYHAMYKKAKFYTANGFFFFSDVGDLPLLESCGIFEKFLIWRFVKKMRREYIGYTLWKSGYK